MKQFLALLLTAFLLAGCSYSVGPNCQVELFEDGSTRITCSSFVWAGCIVPGAPCDWRG